MKPAIKYSDKGRAVVQAKTQPAYTERSTHSPVQENEEERRAIVDWGIHEGGDNKVQRSPEPIE